MRIKKYIASSLKEGKAIILKDLGDDAVVLSSRTTKNPETGEDIVEIVAAIDDKPMKKAADSKSAPEKKITELPVHKSVPDRRSDETRIGDSEKILLEIADLKFTLNEVKDSIKYRYSGSLGEVLGKVYKRLINADLSEEFAMSISGRLAAEKLENDYKAALQRAAEIAVEKVKTVPTLQKSDKRKIVSFIGSSGCGKTSALVKIAVVNKLLHNSNILIVSADTYKVGGAEQLQTFASIAGIDFRSVYSPVELNEIIDKEKEREYIFIDTTGRSHQNKQHLSEITEYLRNAKSDVIYLVQSATSGLSTFEQINKSFVKPEPTAIILTKLDEAAAIGGIVTAMQTANLPIAYLTTGQQIPDDIEPASRKKLAEMLLPETATEKKNE